MKQERTTEFPTEPGMYWFYGYRYGRVSCGSPCKPEHMLVEVVRIANGTLVTANGQIMYRSEVEDAHFMTAVLPEPPKDIWRAE